MAGKIYVFLGPPGSGKGSQATRLATKLGAVFFSIGEYFRQQVKMKTPLGLKVKDIIKRGKLAPNVEGIIINFFRKNSDKDFVLDGFPRNMQQDKEIFEIALRKFNLKLIAIFHLKVSDKEVIKRLTARRNCPDCRRKYNLIYNKER